MKFEDLPRELTPPPELESRTAAALRAEGLLASRNAWPVAVRRLVLAASLLVAFGGGWAARGQGLASPAASSTPRFALLLYGEPTDGAEADRVREYRSWAQRTSAAGHRVIGEKLEDAATTLGPAAGSTEPLLGFFIVEAASEAEAQRIAAAHPHVRHGGTVVVRRIVPT